MRAKKAEDYAKNFSLVDVIQARSHSAATSHTIASHHGTLSAPLLSPSAPPVSPSSLQRSPDDWSEVLDVTSGKPYYVNHVTHETSWNRPCLAQIRFQPPPLPQPSILLPPGWTQQYDSKSQRPYFFNTFTQQTSWDPPAAASFVEPVIDSLPDGWKKGIDPSGKVYFINDRLRLVQSERPRPPAQQMHAVAVQSPLVAASSRRLSVVEQQDIARDAFRKFDKDRSGFIDLAEFVELMRYLNVQMSHDDASAVFMVLDSNGDGEMSQREFEDYWVANMQNTRL